ncbi:MAG TPA: EAL domain-containing protein [Noviherbaspirillum sp.]|nr:EAL domain-containing protein [Noviherbaspirillum sp.]
MERRRKNDGNNGKLTSPADAANRLADSMGMAAEPDSAYVEFQNEYRFALMRYLHGENEEASLLHAYELGRRGATSRLSILNLTEIHQAALLSADAESRIPLDKETANLLAKGAEFLSQALAPFEMMHRGYVETISQLRHLNETLKQQTYALQVSEERMRMFIKHTPAAVAMLDRDLRYVLVSPRWHVDYRLDGRDIIGLRHYDVFPETPQAWRDLYQRCLAGAVDKNEEASFTRADGTLDWVRWEIHPWYTDHGEIGGLIMFTEVVTERKNQERKIARLSRIQSILSAINAAIVRTGNRQDLLQEVCRIAVENGKFRLAWIGFATAAGNAVEPVAAHFADAGTAGAAPTVAPRQEQKLIKRALKRGRPVVCNDIVSGKRLEFWDVYLQSGYRSFVVLPLRIDEKTTGVLCLYAAEPDSFDSEEMKLLSELAEDVSYALDHLVKEERINYLAYYDALTSLPNRDLFFDRLQRQVEAARHEQENMAVLLIDVERFSNINDTFGRHVGDAMLKQIAGRLKARVSLHDSLAHIGGDVFAIMLADIRGAADAAHMLEKLLHECFAPAFQVDDQELYISVKAGISLFPMDGANHDQLYKNAEVALRKAQKNGETYLFYRREMNASVARRLTLENRLYRALERGEFRLHYQPKIDTASGRVVGLESLLRWQEPMSGLIQPAAFIPILEETGMILPVGQWIMEQAIEDYNDWVAKRLAPPPIAVNISVVQLRSRDFVNSLKSIGDRMPDGAHMLDLEITESILMEDIDQNIAKLRAAKDMGMKIAIDDFGTGYSSLSYLTRLPIDLLKIDRSFVTDMNQSPPGLAMVSSVISLAHSLQLGVIAEGVADEEQAKLLRLLRCDQLQGFYCSKPLPAEKVAALLAA